MNPTPTTDPSETSILTSSSSSSSSNNNTTSQVITESNNNNNNGIFNNDNNDNNNNITKNRPTMSPNSKPTKERCNSLSQQKQEQQFLLDDDLQPLSSESHIESSSQTTTKTTADLLWKKVAASVNTNTTGNANHHYHQQQMSYDSSSISDNIIKNKKKGWDTVRIEDLLQQSNPLETEAETMILKALEHEEKKQHKRHRSSLSGQENTYHNLLPNIPNDAAKIFQQNTLQEEEEEEYDDDKYNNEQQHSTIRTNLSITGVENNNITNNNSNTAVLNRAQLRRTKTVEEQLACLTVAMLDIHQQQNQPTTEFLSNTTGGNNNNELSSLLDNNANLIYRGGTTTNNNNKNKQDIGNNNNNNNNGNAEKNWNRLRTAIKNNKKAQDIVVDGNNNVIKTTYTTSDDKSFTQQQQYYDLEAGNNNNNNNNAENYDKTHNNDMTTTTTTVQKEEKKKSSSNYMFFKKMNGFHLHRKMAIARDFEMFIGQRRKALYSYIRFMCFVVIPALITACILFYGSGNPPTGKQNLEEKSEDGLFVNEKGEPIDPKQASASWWVLFICVRQAITFSLARMIQVLVIDFLCLSTRMFVRVFGNFFTLFIVQSKGWPFTLFIWGILDFALLHGSSRFASHWLYWQDFAGVFNDENPGGMVTSDIWNTRALSIAVAVGFVVSVKRLWLGLYLGRQTYSNYAEDLAKVVKKVLTLCELATLSRDCMMEASVNKRMQYAPSLSRSGFSREQLDRVLDTSMTELADDTLAYGVIDDSYNGGLILDPERSRNNILEPSQRMRINELLGAWEDPEEEFGKDEDISISAILQFRQSLSFLENRYMFSLAWGDVSTREKMVLSSQDIYKGLLLKSSDPDILKFDVLALLARRPDGSLDQEMAKELIRLFRPERDGSLSLLNFVKTTDSIYKEAKLLRATVKNSEKIDRAFEKAFNLLFYVIMTCVILTQIGFDPLALFLSLSSIILAFAFMIGAAASKMFEGFLFILIRRPYGIGDRIHIADPMSETNPAGSASWIVKDVTLFHTTAVFAATNERATMANGSIAAARVINMARSPHGQLFLLLKFAVDTPYEKIQVFEQALRQFVKARPREWANFTAFRPTQIQADLGFVEYKVILLHRESWQNIGALMTSKAEVSSFCLELSRKLDMRYQCPPLPVDLAVVKRGQPDHDNQSILANFAGIEEGQATGLNEITALFDKEK